MKALLLTLSLAGALLSLPACAATPAPEAAPASPGKPGAPVELNYELLGTPAVGQPLTLRLDFRASGEADDLSISYAGEGALSLQAAAAENLSLRAEPTPHRELTVVPRKEGMHYVNVFVRLGERSRSFSVPIQVGKVDVKAALKPQGELSTTPEGERLISLPAQETVEKPRR